MQLQLIVSRLLGNAEIVFFPKRWVALNPELSRDEPPTRIERTNVYITLPMYALRDLCMRKIKNALRCDSHVFHLEIPSSLQREIYNLRPKKPDLEDR